ncbi:unnamed protein product [Arctogadus glacialis]
MVTLAVQPRLAEARPEPDTPAQLRATVNTNLTTDPLNYTLQESKRAATRRASAKTEQKKDSLEKRKKRERFTLTLLNAYNVAINMDTEEGRPTHPGHTSRRGSGPTT